LFFIEKLVETEVVSEISSAEVLHCHVEILAILEGGFHIDDEGVADLLEYGFFVEYRSYAFFE
jgi:hypothetical protein